MAKYVATCGQCESTITRDRQTDDRRGDRNRRLSHGKCAESLMTEVIELRTVLFGYGAGVRALPVQESSRLQLVEPSHHHSRRLRQQRTVQLHCSAEVACSTQDFAQPHCTASRETVGTPSTFVLVGFRSGHHFTSAHTSA